MDGIRPGGSLAFDRLRDGSVVIARIQHSPNNKEIVRFTHVMDPVTWAEVVAYVSQQGSTEKQINRAGAFHMVAGD